MLGPTSISAINTAEGKKRNYHFILFFLSWRRWSDTGDDDYDDDVDEDNNDDDANLVTWIQ